MAAPDADGLADESDGLTDAQRIEFEDAIGWSDLRALSDKPHPPIGQPLTPAEFAE